MANIMTQRSVENKVHRSGFDLSFRNCFTAKVGEILPVSVDEVLPGDKWSINLRQFMRTAPVSTASFGRIRQYYDFYFVPYRLLWDKFPSWVVQTKNAYHAQTLISAAQLSEHHPYFNTDQFDRFITNQHWNQKYLDNGLTYVYGVKKLMNYLGYGLNNQAMDKSTRLALNPFPILAYQKIYQDYFRFAQWEDAAPWTYNLDFIMKDTDLPLDLDTLALDPDLIVNNMFTLRTAYLDRDYFMGMLPNSQFGDTAIASPLEGNMKTNGVSLSPLVKTGNYTYGIGLDASGKLGFYNKSTGAFVSSPAGLSAANLNFNILNTSTAGLSVLMIRQAEALQKWKEITMSGSPDYKDQISKHWNVNVSDDMSYKCRYLGGIQSDIDVSEVINTNLAGEGDTSIIKGKGVSASNGHIEFESKDYGILMCVYHAKPIIEWVSDNLLTRLNAKTTVTDYAIPEFDSIGMQQILSYEMFKDNDPGDPDSAFEPVGYAPRYIEYKTKYDQIHGAFATTLKQWNIPFGFQGQGAEPVTYYVFKIPANLVNDMFGVVADSTVDTDQLYNTIYVNSSVVRNLSRDGLPY